MRKSLVLVLALAGWTLGAAAQDAARVDDEAITRAQLDREVNRVVRRSGGKLSTTPELVRFVLNNLVSQKLRDRYIRAQGIAVTNVELYEAVKERRQAVKEQYDMELEDWVRSEGYDHDTFREQLRSGLALEKYNARVTTSEALEDHLARHANRFNGEARLVRHIGVSARPGVRDRQAAEKLLNDLRRQIETGADFGEIASRHSDGPGKDDAGRLGYVPWDSKDLAKPFLRIIFSLKPGELSPVVAGGQGFHLFRVDEIRPGRKVSLDEVREQVRRDFLEEHLTAVVAGERKKAKIEILLNPGAPAREDHGYEPSTIAR